MITGEAIIYLQSIDPQEPVFILRGQDQLTARTVLAWVDLAADAGVHPTKIDDALRCLITILDWPHKKVPD